VCQEVLAAKGLSLADLDEVVMVGGQSRMPLVARRIGEALGREPTRGVHPDEAVAIGAALLADSASRIDSVVLIDVLPMGIGVGLPGGRMAPVIPRNARLPVRRSYELATVRDGQADLELAVFQGDSPRVAECEYLGTVRVEGLPPAPRGAAKVAVEFTLGAEGILAVAARDLGTGRVTQARLATLETPEAVRARLGVTDPPAPPPGQRPTPLARVRPQASAPRRSFLERLLGR
jgi:molecular chaperone DnaK